MIKARGLKEGDRIGLVAPASPVEEGQLEGAIQAMEDLGLEVLLGESCRESYGYLAGSDQVRARDINQMFEREDVDGIVCLRGGYGSSRIVELLDYDLIQARPKVFVGYSDITALHLAINQKAGLVTYHGPMAASDFAGGIDDFSLASFKNAVFAGDYRPDLVNPAGQDLVQLGPGRAEGQVTGGNLCLVAHSLGTSYEIETQGRILLLEEVGEDPYAVDRMLTQLRLAGKFEGLEGIILGDFADCRARKEEYEDQLPLVQVFRDLLSPLGLPIIYNLQLGHCQPVLTLPLGVRLGLDADQGLVEILERPNL